MKKFLLFICFVLTLSSKATGKETTYSKQLFDKAISEGKVVVVSSWIKYCSSCAGQMEVLKKAKKDFENMEYFAFDVTNKEIAQFFNVQYQTTLISVVFPAPFGPSIAKISPFLIFRFIFFNASKPFSYTFVRLFMLI